MKAAAKGFCSVEGRRGVSIGILPGEYIETNSEHDCRPPAGYPNEFVEVLIQTHMMGSKAATHEAKMGPTSRNRVTVLSSDFVVAIGGGAGTRSEAELSVRLGKPIVFYGQSETWHADYPTIEHVNRTDDLMAALARAPRR